MFGLLLFFFPQTTSPTGDARIKPQISESTKTDVKCWGDDPQKHVARLGWISDPRATVKIRYNKRTKTCLVEIELRVIRDGEIVMLSRSIGDTEGREYANFIRKAATNSGEAPAIFCEVFLSSGEQLECHSENEFDEIVGSLVR